VSVPRLRFGVFAQLASLVAGLAAASTLLALVIQDRTLSADLRAAADDRLSSAAVAADRLMDDHLTDVRSRYSTASATPEFRANLEAGDRRTLEYHARSLAERLGAAAIAFHSPEGRLVALSGDEALEREATQRLGADTGAYLLAGGRLYAATSVPLFTGDTSVGHLLGIEEVGPDVLTAWSIVLGVDATVGPEEVASPDEIVSVVRTFSEGSLRVSTTYEPERQAIARARRNLLVSGLVALVAAVLAALLVAHRFAGPVRRMKRAAERVGGEPLDIDFDIRRTDELGDLGRAFRDMLSRLRDSEARLARAQRLARFTNWSVDLETGEIEAGHDFRRLFDLEHGADIGVDDLGARVHAEDRGQFEAALQRARQPKGSFRTEVRIQMRNGRYRVLDIRGQRREAASGSSRVEASVQDVTERWNYARQIQYLSLHDSVTGLGNREYLIERLGVQLKQAERDGTAVALLFLGLEGVSSVGGALGHQVGDALLSEVAERLVATLGVPRHHDRRKRRDSSSYAAVRLSSSEFAVVDQVMGREEAAALARSVREALEEPYLVDDHDISLTVSIGISLFPDDADTVDALVRYGTTALEAGRAHSDPYHFYDEAMEERQARRLSVASRLRRAIECEELVTHYQPRVHPESGLIVAVEALTRWTHEDLGAVTPDEFVPIAEDAGLIHQLGDWCLRAAVQDLLRWQSLGWTDLRVSVNVSPQQLQSGLVERVLDVTSQVDPTSLEFEVTESAVIRNPEEALQILGRMADHGFRIALDDFGTGHSSLSLVRQLPLHAIKIDRSFIQDLSTNENARSITQAVISMCQAMSLDSVGEGVETEDQCRRLIDLGCDELQGFYFSRAVPAADLERMLEEQRTAEAVPERRLHARRGA